MKRESIFILFACALGAGLGTWVAIELATLYSWSHWLWPLGAIFGGVIGYLVYDPKGLLRGIVRAGKRTYQWQPYLPFWRAIESLFVGSMALGASLMLFLVAVLLMAGVQVQAFLAFPIFAPGLWVAVGLLWVAVGLAMFWSSVLLIRFPSRKKGESVEEYEEELRDLAKFGIGLMQANPIHVLLIRPVQMMVAMLRAIPTSLPRIPGRLWSAVTKAAGFARLAFRYVHSDKRKLCLVDAAIGAMVGFYVGNPLVGGAVGAILGVINYEFVSIRWLKLAPRRAR